jgi:uncharacterized protein
MKGQLSLFISRLLRYNLRDMTASLTPMTLNSKLKRLRGILRGIGPAVVAFSGGVDSAFLARVARDTLPGKVLAVTVVSAFFPASERQDAVRLARQIRVPHRLVREPLAPGLRRNPPDRCYHCKKKTFARLLRIARQKGYAALLDGSNADDALDYRPGARALRELRVRSPLQEAGLTKRDIRALSKRMGLSTWDKPAMTCLATRFPYGEDLTKEKFGMVERAEAFLRSMGIRQIRVRHHGQLCRIEAGPGDIAGLMKKSGLIVRRLKALGYAYVTVDLQGYRSGAMDEVAGWTKKS